MEKLWKKFSLGMVLLFILMIFAPYTALAEDEPASGKPTLTQTDGNYTVSSVEDLNKLRSDIDNGIDYSGQHVVLTQDIDAGSGNLSSFTTNNAFNGVFNGGFHTIGNYTDAASGLFGVVGKNGIVENVKIDADVVVNDKSKVIALLNTRFYGLISNQDEGTVIRCSTTGTIQNTITAVRISGIVGSSNAPSASNGYISDCYSNVTLDNQVESSSPIRAGICISPGTSVQHSYFNGKFLKPFNLSDGDPIISRGGAAAADAATCVYNSDAEGVNNRAPKGDPTGCSSDEMKNKDSYTALGFDFDKTWMIDTTGKINNGYPYLNPDNESKVPAKIPVDIKITAQDKIYVPGADMDPLNLKTTDDSLKAQIADVSVAPESDGDADLISQYDVSAAYDGDVYFNAPTIGDVPLNIDSTKIKISFTPNDDYDFVVGNFSATGKLQGDGTAAPTEDEEKQQIEDAKKAENILYSKLGVGKGAVTSFEWTGDRSTVSGNEGSIILNDYDWEVFSSARSGYKVGDGYYDDWFAAVKDELKKMEKQGINVQDVKMTEWEKLVLAITATGYDPRDVTYNGDNLIDIISNKNYLNVSAQTFAWQYAVMALTSYDYMDSVPQDEKHIGKADIDSTIHDEAKKALGTTGADGSAVLGNSVTDMWIMGFQPIAAYYDPNAESGSEYYDVKQAMDHVFDQISNSQAYGGSFWGGHTDIGAGTVDLNNPWTNAQVYMTLGMAKANPFDSKYVKDGNTMINAALERFDVEKGTTIYGNSTYEPTQICRGLDSLVRDYEGRNSIFDCTDVTDSTVPVNNDIEKLPAADSITSSDKAQVDAAKASYDALSKEKKASISQSVKDELTAAERKVSPVQIVPDPSLEGKTFKANDTVNIPVKVKNTSGSDQKVSLITALYDNNGKLIKYVSPEGQTVAAEASAALTNTIDIPAEGGYKLKTFIWDGLDDMNPLSDVITIPADSNK